MADSTMNRDDDEEEDSENEAKVVKEVPVRSCCAVYTTNYGTYFFS